MKILSLDQSTKCTGYSIFDNDELLKYGTLEVNDNDELFYRMIEMTNQIKNLVELSKPDFVIFEDVQFQNNYKTFKILSQFQGMIIKLLFELNINFEIIEGSRWKSFNNIKGKKREEQKINTIKMVKYIYDIDVSEDIADAIGIGRWAISNVRLNK